MALVEEEAGDRWHCAAALEGNLLGGNDHPKAGRIRRAMSELTAKARGAPKRFT